MNTYSIASIKNYLSQLQNNIRVCLEKEDGKAAFKVHHWKRTESGNGCTMALCDGSVIEKAGVNFSHVWGKNLPAAATASRPQLTGYNFEALGLSVIVHPRNPYAPTCHFNVRFFSAEKASEKPIWWFGGGFDLTPYYGFIEDCQHWHRLAKQTCEPFGADIYPRFKKWADDYFYLPHRQEPRGIGGIFFDDWNEWEFERCFALMQQVSDHFILAYQPILNRRKDMPYGARERDFQCYRRGRYVEFNLVYDRGTLFGLKFGGRIESILISLPPEVKWRYDWQPPAGSEEEKLYKEFLIPKEWI